MHDIYSGEKRSEIMRSIRSKDTLPERMLRSELHKRGYRFRLHLASLPGKPDIVFSRYKTVIFVHGCFWHRHLGCKRNSMPKSNQSFWIEKFNANCERDCEDAQSLKRLGWKVITLWECEIEKDIAAVVKSICSQMIIVTQKRSH